MILWFELQCKEATESGPCELDSLMVNEYVYLWKTVFTYFFPHFSSLD